MDEKDSTYDRHTPKLLKAGHIAYYSRNGLESLCKIGYKGNLYKLNQYVDSNIFKQIKPKFSGELIVGSFGALDRARKASWVLSDAVYITDMEVVITKGRLKGNKVTKMGAVTDKGLIEVFKKINVYVSTANVEGGPMGVLEAMACGIPVVITDTGFAGDIIKHGINGFLIPFKDPQALARRLESIESNVRAIELYKKVGFVEEGRKKQHIYKNGEYLDLICMCIFDGKEKEK